MTQNQPHKPKIIAHRGASADAPENTLSSIKRAISLAVDYVEIDVRLSREGVPVIFHDATISRITKVRYGPHVHKMHLHELDKVDAGHHFHPSFKGEPIPTLAEVLELDWGTTGLMIEIKKGHYAAGKIVAAIYEVIRSASRLPQQLLIGSFEPEIIDPLIALRIHTIAPTQLIGIAENQAMIEPFIHLGVSHLALWHRIIKPELMQALAEKNVDVWAFTVDRIKLCSQLISLNVKGIITNDPRYMLEHRNFDLI
jgi:glycerophosphoryl diester phosphodiesterase